MDDVADTNSPWELVNYTYLTRARRNFQNSQWRLCQTPPLYQSTHGSSPMKGINTMQSTLSVANVIIRPSRINPNGGDSSGSWVRNREKQAKLRPRIAHVESDGPLSVRTSGQVDSRSNRKREVIPSSFYWNLVWPTLLLPGAVLGGILPANGAIGYFAGTISTLLCVFHTNFHGARGNRRVASK